MLLFKLAFRNVIGAGLRTWLNVIVLSLSFVTIIAMQGLYKGMQYQAEDAMMQVEYAGGQYWHPAYDPYDPFTLEDSHQPVSGAAQRAVAAGDAIPILFTQATIYPQGRVSSALLKGIPPEQEIMEFPSEQLLQSDHALPAIVGTRMAKSNRLAVGDYLTVRWRDANGTFDAQDVQIVHVFSTIVSSVDAGQIWVPLERLQSMLKMPNEATLLTLRQGLTDPPVLPGWDYKGLDILMADLREMVTSKQVGGSIMYLLLLFLALLAIFDTQVLSIWRRKKEMGTLMAMGLTRRQLIGLFTIEGGMYGVLAALLGALYGTPLIVWFATHGWEMPEMVDDFGFAIASKLVPSYSFFLVLGSTLLVLATVTIVSYLPTRRIAKLEPTDALRGKLT
ncbi:MAG: FtsX-like permease family protein [Candidatus Marinimicrobia bacterium]|nr:FtsX-like permease family protein [Candidatus Neomarinimicrobiota bacterium]MCF7840879.1 FtsX-like permease family protein [Candidatus Neomarinimicrobiota bacterium]